jgi:hypothetical protein
MKIRLWCDSGANIHSCREEIIETETYWGMSDEEWSEMSEDEKAELVNDWAHDRLEIGWEPV